MTTLDTYVVDNKILTPQEFLSLSKEEKRQIKYSEILPPILGETVFPYGAIQVFYNEPTYTTNIKNV